MLCSRQAVETSSPATRGSGPIDGIRYPANLAIVDAFLAWQEYKTRDQNAFFDRRQNLEATTRAPTTVASSSPVVRRRVIGADDRSPKLAIAVASISAE